MVPDEVRFVVTDWKPMQAALRALIQDYQNMPPPIAVDELAAALEFMQWILDNHFTLMGVRTFDFTGNVAKGDLKPKARDGLGILRDPKAQVLRRGADLVVCPRVTDGALVLGPAMWHFGWQRRDAVQERKT